MNNQIKAPRAANKNRIESVRIEQVIDESPDTSYLGKYTDEASPDCIIARGEHYGKQIKALGEDAELPERGRTLRYFLPANAECAEDALKDFARMESLNNGAWWYVGIIAKAVVVSASGVCQTLRSGGLWGVESDSGKEYLDSIAAEQLAELRAELESFGFGARAINYAFKNVSE